MKNFTSIALVFISFLMCAQTIAQESKPNILLIIADDLGIDGLEGFGMELNNFPTTPNIQSLQESGVTYMHSWATPVCSPTRSSIMSGKYGINTGVMEVGGNLDLEHESIFNYLDRVTNNEYSSAVIGKWHLSSPTNNNHPLEHGADHFEGVIRGGVQDYYNWEKVENGQEVQIQEYITTHFTNSAIDWIDNQNQPWFLWLSHVAPHSPYHLPPDGLYTIDNPTNNSQLFRAATEALDHEIGRLLDSLDEETRENTIIIFIGDNGSPNNVLRGFPNRHGKGSLFEGGIRVPMVISGKGVNRSGVEEMGLTQVNDLYASIIEIAANDLEGGIYNSYSIKSSLEEENSIERNFIYSDVIMRDTAYWAIRNQEYKLIGNEFGGRELYRVDTNLDETENLMLNLNVEEEAIMQELEAESQAIRSGWSCQDFILNGDEAIIDACVEIICTEIDILSFENIGCCDSPDEPSVYYEYLENGQRNIYSNGFPNHDYCYNPNNIPTQVYHYYRIPIDPVVTDEPTQIIRNNGRPARHVGVALNGVILSPAPGTPFIYTNKLTGEFNWDWVFEPTSNQGDANGHVRLDCATAHTNANGYHYHGEMDEHLETIQPGITSANSLSEVLQIAWASDGHPIVYKFGPDADGNMKELQPSFRLKSGERPGDGIVAPCGPYTGKYTVDYEYVPGLGDLDECNGIAASITLETALGTETFDYYYVVTSSFPQISRCLVGEVSEDFENGQDPITGIDLDGDGYLSQFECDDNSAAINPSAEDIPNNGIDEDCDGADLTTSINELDNSLVRIYPNPVSDFINIEVSSSFSFQTTLFDLKGKQILRVENQSTIDVSHLPAGTYLMEVKDINTGASLVEKVLVE